jgi:CelD/BcsL family acetyltransferase involved in cellulose biosynthesis
MAQIQINPYAQQVEQEDLKVELISDFARFQQIAPEWDSLVSRAGIEHPFLSHLWLATWWECFGSGKELHVVTVRTPGGELAGAAPLMIAGRKTCGIRTRRLETIYNYHTPRCDFIVTEPQAAVYDAIWNVISTSSMKWDVVILAQVPDMSSTVPEITIRAEADGWKAGEWQAPPSPYIPLSSSHEQFFSNLKRTVRYNLRKRYEKLCAAGPVDVEIVTDPCLVREAMQDGLRIEAAAWKGAAGTAINSDPAVREFYIRLAERAAELGLLRLTFLRFAGRRIAFDYILCNGKTISGVKIGYDPDYHAYSPGNMLLNLILQGACNEGIREYDFLGVDDEWKFEWTKETRSHRWLFLFRNTPRARLVHALKFRVVPLMRRFRQFLR